MRTWLISDTHFNHNNIIKYCDRPYSSTEEMNKDLIKRWNNTVAKDDIVYHLGDFGMGTKEQITELVSQLNGRIYLIMGNHDHHTVSWYYDCGFARVYDRPVLYNDIYILSHHPRELVSPDYKYIYGHTHERSGYATPVPNATCVCVEQIGYTPILFEDVVRKLEIF